METGPVLCSDGLCLMSRLVHEPNPRPPPERPARHKFTQSRTWGGAIARELEHVKNKITFELAFQAIRQPHVQQGIVSGWPI